MIISSRIQTIYTYNSSLRLFKLFEERETTRLTTIITMHVLCSRILMNVIQEIMRQEVGLYTVNQFMLSLI